MFDALLEAGAPWGAAPGAVNQTRRIESGILSWGADMTPEENPYELGLGSLVELDTTPDFIGRAALEAVSRQPPSRKLVGMVLSGEALSNNEKPWPLYLGDKAVGKLTSLTHSPRLRKNLGLGLVPTELSEIGTELSFDAWDKDRIATISELPFVPKRQQGNARDLLESA